MKSIIYSPELNIWRLLSITFSSGLNYRNTLTRGWWSQIKMSKRLSKLLWTIWLWRRLSLLLSLVVVRLIASFWHVFRINRFLQMKILTWINTVLSLIKAIRRRLKEQWRTFLIVKAQRIWGISSMIIFVFMIKIQKRFLVKFL